jgi:L-lactate permease
VLTASVNSAAGVMGKMISLTSIAVAVAANGHDLGGREQAVPVHHQAQHLLMLVWASSR